MSSVLGVLKRVGSARWFFYYHAAKNGYTRTKTTAMSGVVTFTVASLQSK
jgi:hypothetical protein